MSSLTLETIDKSTLSKHIVRTKAVLYFPFGIDGAKQILKEWKDSKITLDEILLNRVVKNLKDRYYYTDKDIEFIKEHDDLEGQVNTWLDRNRRMLELGDGGLYQTLIFKISPRTIEDGPQ